MTKIEIHQAQEGINIPQNRLVVSTGLRGLEL